MKADLGASVVEALLGCVPRWLLLCSEPRALCEPRWLMLAPMMESVP